MALALRYILGKNSKALIFIVLKKSVKLDFTNIIDPQEAIEDEDEKNWCCSISYYQRLISFFNGVYLVSKQKRIILT